MKFNRRSSEYLSMKMDQYEKVAIEIKSVIDECNMEDAESGFELAKEMLLNNERMDLKRMLSKAFREYFADIGKWFALFFSFILSIIKSVIPGNINIFQSVDFWGIVISLFIIGYVIDASIKIWGTKTEELHIEILRKMAYEQYKYLLNHYKIHTEKFLGKI